MFGISSFDLIALPTFYRRQMGGELATHESGNPPHQRPRLQFPLRFKDPNISLNFSTGMLGGTACMSNFRNDSSLWTTFNDALSRHQSRSWGAHYLRSLLGNSSLLFFQMRFSVELPYFSCILFTLQVGIIAAWFLVFTTDILCIWFSIGLFTFYNLLAKL